MKNFQESEIREDLMTAGCSGDEAESILHCLRTGNRQRMEKVISGSRKRQLDRMHESQYCIDRLDYLQFQMRKAME